MAGAAEGDQNELRLGIFDLYGWAAPGPEGRFTAHTHASNAVITGRKMGNGNMEAQFGSPLPTTQVLNWVDCVAVAMFFLLASEELRVEQRDWLEVEENPAPPRPRPAIRF
jgi:hypothetical protein